MPDSPKVMWWTWRTEIERHIVSKGGDAFLWYVPCDPCWHPTWEAARDYLLARAEIALQSAQGQLARAEQELAEIKALTPPKETNE